MSLTRITAIEHLRDTAETLLAVLYDLNKYGDAVASSIATQAEGCAYGEVHEGLRKLLDEIYPNVAEETLLIAMESGISLRDAYAQAFEQQDPIED